MLNKACNMHYHRLMPLLILSTIIVLGIFVLSQSCSRRQNHASETIIVSIAPFKYIVESIIGDDSVAIEVLLPEGVSPETYSPTPRQIASIENASLIFVTGLIPFETEIIRDKSLKNSEEKIFILSKGLSLLTGSHNHEGHEAEIDPHIWTSPKRFKTISATIYNAINYKYKTNDVYFHNYQKLCDKIDSVSFSIKEMLAVSGVKKFLIYHPALTYYADDYGLTQMSIEDEGKEPSVTHIKNITEEAKQAQIKQIIHQREFPRYLVEPLAEELNAEIVEINPLSEDILEEIVRITNVISSHGQANNQ